MGSAGDFFSRNRYAIVATALAGASAAGAYYYYKQQLENGEAYEDSSSKKKKNKKKKKSKYSGDGSSESDAAEKLGKTSTGEKVYPVDSRGLPKIDDSIVKNLSDSDKEQWAVSLKEDGNYEFKNKKYEDAIAYYSAALKLKTDPVFYSNRSACYAALGDHENVVKDTSEAIKMKPDYTKCVLRRATSYEILERFPDAMFDLTALTIYGGFSNKSVEQVLERVLKKHSLKIVEENLKHRTPQLPSSSTIGSFFGAFLPETDPEGIKESTEEADKILNDALTNLNANTQEGYDKADTLFSQAAKAYDAENLDKTSPNSAKATIALEYAAAFRFLRNDPSSAIAIIQKAVSLHPRPKTYILKALINADRASFAEALADFEEAKRMDPDCADTYYHIGQLYYLTGDLLKAEENFSKGKELYPQNVYTHIQLACITYKNGDVKGAEDRFTEAKLKFPTSPEIPNYFGEILADRGDIQAACKQFDTAARLQAALPTYSVGALPLINKATLISRESLERVDEAEQLLTQACELDPRSELARISLAQIKLQREQVDEAIALFEESSDLARTVEEKVQATSFAEATKMQKRIKNDPVLTKKIEEVMRKSMM